jgi:hypothetical protein
MKNGKFLELLSEYESFESDASRWLCKNIYARTQVIIYEHVGKKKNY